MKQWNEDRLIATNTVKKVCSNSNAAHRFENSYEIIYCLRGIRENLTDIERVFLVVPSKEHHKSEYISQELQAELLLWKESDKELEWVYDHDLQTAPSPPFFSSHAIEMLISNIPGLDEIFLYSNDDCFVLNPLTSSYWKSLDNSKWVIHCTGESIDGMFSTKVKQGGNAYTKQFSFLPSLLQQQEEDVKKLPFQCHAPSLQRKTVHKNLIARMSQELKSLSSDVFRKGISLTTACGYEMYYSGTAKFVEGNLHVLILCLTFGFEYRQF